jgi:hypothetical protein
MLKQERIKIEDIEKIVLVKTNYAYFVEAIEVFFVLNPSVFPHILS